MPDKEMMEAVAASVDGLAENDLETFENQGDDCDMPPFAYLQVFRAVGLFIDLNEESVEDLINTGFLPDECSGRSKEQVREALLAAIPAKDGWVLMSAGEFCYWSPSYDMVVAEAQLTAQQFLSDHYKHAPPEDMRKFDLRVYKLGHPGTVEIPLMEWTHDYYLKRGAYSRLEMRKDMCDKLRDELVDLVLAGGAPTEKQNNALHRARALLAESVEECDAL